MIQNKSFTKKCKFQTYYQQLLMICLKMYTAKDYVDEDYDTEAYVMIEQKFVFRTTKTMI